MEGNSFQVVVYPKFSGEAVCSETDCGGVMRREWFHGSTYKSGRQMIVSLRIYVCNKCGKSFRGDFEDQALAAILNERQVLGVYVWLS